MEDEQLDKSRGQEMEGWGWVSNCSKWRRQLWQSGGSGGEYEWDERGSQGNEQGLNKGRVKQLWKRLNDG